MKLRARSAFLTAPAVLAITLTGAVSACGSTAALRSGHSAADPGGSRAAASGAAASVGTDGASGRAVGTSTAAVPPAARRVQCPVVIPIIRLPDVAQPYASVQPHGPVQPGGPVQLGEPIPAGFRPVAVVECVTVASVNHGVVRIGQRRQAAIAGLGRLLAALREPRTPLPRGPLPACLMPAVSRPWFVLVGATGQVIHPLVPAGLCGEPIGPVLASLNSLHWILLGTTALHPAPFGPPLHGGPIHDITPGITLSN